MPCHPTSVSWWALCMAKTTGQPKHRETPRAADAFFAYVALGPSRSLRKLADSYVQQNRYKTASTALRILADWSVANTWQDRLEQAATEASDAMLKRAAELDADTFLKISQDLNTRVNDHTAGIDIDRLVKVRESVRKPAPKGAGVSVGVSINLNVQQQEILQRVADRRGVSVDDLLSRTTTLIAGDC